MKKEDLLKIIEGDDLGLLKVKPKVSSQATADERLVVSFEEINKFVSDNDREPSANNGILEHTLYARLKSIREDVQKSSSLTSFDNHELLANEIKKIETIDDILNDDDIGILDSDSDMFQLKHVPKQEDRAEPEYIAKRKPCKNFDKFEHLFIDCHEDLKAGRRTLNSFHTDQNIKKGTFFILNGVMLFVDAVNETKKDKYGKIDGRLKCIFENGTESNMLLRSLGKGLYQDGRVVSDKNIDTMNIFNQANNEDKEAGFIYVLKSLSDDTKIQSIDNLYKIGFSKLPVEERIKNAEQEPTYLMSPVSIVSIYQCYNMNTQRFEQLLHNFFGGSCLNVDIFDNENQRHTPREWFIAPMEQIEHAINLLISGEIVNYYYDVVNEKIFIKQNN